MVDLKKTEIGLLPKDWEVCHFGDVGDVYSGFAFKSADFNKSGIPVVKIGELQGGRIVFTEKTDFVNSEFIKNQKIKKYILQAGDLLIAMTGATTGKVAKVREENPPCLLNQRVGKIKSISDRLDNNFIVYLMQTSGAQNFIQNQILKSAQGNVSPTSIKNLLIPLPSLVDQHNITHILSKIQSAIEAQEKIIQTTTELKKALMQKLFTEGLRGEPQKETEIGRVPKSWEIKSFEEVVTLQRGQDLPKSKFVRGEIPVAGSNGIIGFHNACNVKKPGVTVGRSGSCGKVVFYCDNFWAHNTILYVKDFHENDKKFIYYFLIHQKLERFRSGVSVPTLNRNDFSKIKVAVPGKSEQIGIANLLLKLDEKIDFSNKKRQCFFNLFNSMLHHLMTGQIRVKDVRFS